MITIGILYICTGKYSIFWKAFYESSEQYFLPDAEKHYFVFTDSSEINETDKIHVYYEKPKGFPLDSLLRFDMFLGIKKEVSIYDYAFFFNSNMVFVRKVSRVDILPDGKKERLVAVLHPGYYNKEAMAYNYERRRASTAFIPYDRKNNYHYFMGGLNGGITEDYYRLIDGCNRNIHQDMDDNIMAIYHDESHLNKYLYDRDDVKILPPSYGFPEDGKLPFEPYIVIQNKMKHGGKYFDKLPKAEYRKRLIFFVKRNLLASKWRLGL